MEDQLARARASGHQQLVGLLEAVRDALRAECGEECAAAPPDNGPGAAPGPDRVTLQKETSSAATGLVAEDGGTVEAVDRAGNRYTLTVPPGALLEPTMITLTPLREARGLPVCGGEFFGVDASPEGLRFYEVARLEITPAGRSEAADAIAFSSRSDGQELHLHPLAVERDRLVFEVVHFSTAMVYLDVGDAGGPVLRAPPKAPVDWEKAIPNEIAERTRLEREAQIEGRPGDPNYGEDVRILLEKYYGLVVEPLLPRIELDCEFARDNMPKVIGFARNAELFLGAGAAPMSEPILRTARAAMENCFRTTVTPCLDRKNSEQVSRAAFFGSVAQLMGADAEEFDPFNPRYSCTGDAIGTVTWARTVEDTRNYPGAQSQLTTTEKLEINALFERDGDGFRNAGTGYTYTFVGEGEFTSDTRCRGYTTEGSALSSGAASFAFFASREPTEPDSYVLDMGGFGVVGTSVLYPDCSPAATQGRFYRSSPEFRDNGCSLRSPDGPFPGNLEGRAERIGEGRKVHFDCTQTRTRSGRTGVTEFSVRETVSVTGSILITVP